MKFTNQSCEIWTQGDDLYSIWKHIERCGRVCYQSDKPSEDSKKWCMSKVKNGHMSILEHGTIYLNIPQKNSLIADFFITNKYSHVNHIDGHYYVTTNVRVIIENSMEYALAFLCPLTMDHMPRYTISIITDLAVARELNRHRVQSISEESTRYCNYSKDKFDNSLNYVNPVWMKGGNVKPEDFEAWDKLAALYRNAEETYLELLKIWPPQRARRALPLGLKVQTIHTATRYEWEDFFNKRYYEKTGKVDENMLEISTQIYKLLNPLLKQ